jgi:hypothetical protein
VFTLTRLTGSVEGIFGRLDMAVVERVRGR